MCWSVFKIVAEASKCRQNTVLTTTAATARASFTANYGKVTRCNDYSRHTSYKSRLITIKLLPLMYWLELQDVLFLVKCLQGTTNNFNIHDFIPAPSSSHRPTRASESGKFKHKLCRTVTGHHFYLNRIIRLCERPSHN